MAGWRPAHQTPNGFTLVELLVVLVITTTLLGLVLANLGQPQETANTNTTIDALLSDIKAQQSRAMSGDSGGTVTAQAYGIYIQPGQYTLFIGSSYNPADPTNFVVVLPGSLTLSTTLPSSQVIFSKGSGEVQGYTAGLDTLTLVSPHRTDIMTINRLGAVAVN